MFGYFLMLIAVTIAGVAGYFSVYGLAHIFAGAFWAVVIMGGVLEVGKLVATSFVYRYWDTLNIAMKAYLLAAIIGLMGITSAGIFGYLSNAYQQDIIGVKDVRARIELLDTELVALTARESEINEDIGRIASNYVTARQNMMKQYAPEKDALTKRVAEIRSERLELASKQLEVEAHTGPIIYIAKAMDRGVDEAVMWMICLIIFVFDPLAIALTIGANMAMGKRPQPQAPPSLEDSTVVEELNVNQGPDEREQQLIDLQGDLIDRERMIQELSEHVDRLEDELLAVVPKFERKDAQIAQLKEAVRQLEQQRLSPSIRERAALHAMNQLAAKE